MSEVNYNTNALDSQSHGEFVPEIPNSYGSQTTPDITTPSNNLELSQTDSETETASLVDNQTSDVETTDQPKTNCSSTKSMDWQKVAHKLREYNRKLLKKVFKLEQDLAEVENKFQKLVEKSQGSDVLNAQQAEEIKEYQQETARLEQQLEIFQQETHSQQVVIERLSKQLELSQKQTAQLERECALLQENYNKKTYELIATEKEAQELHNRLNRQQHYTMQYKAALERYVNEVGTKSDDSLGNKAPLPQIKNKPIQAWSVSSVDKKLSLPKTKSQILPVNNNLQAQANSQSSTTQNTEWIAPEISKPKKNNKPQSLAAVELPQLPRQS